MNIISRRDALMGATAAAITTGAITAPLAIKAAGVKEALANDVHIAALYTEWRAAEATWIKVNAVADNAHMDAIRVSRESPDQRAAYRAAVERYDVSELKRRADVTATAESAALHRLIEAPAEGPRGAMIKLTAFIEEIEVVGMDNRMLATIRNDLERLAGGLPS